jgi:hypothetical protein
MAEALAAVRALLVADATVASLVPAARIQALRRPQGDSALPAIVLQQVSRVTDPAVGAALQPRYSRSRIQATLLAADYPGLVALCTAVDLALTYRAGTFGGVIVTTIERELVGPDLVDDDTGTPYRQVDFMVWHRDT